MNATRTAIEFSSDRTGRWSRAVARGEARRIAPGIYTTETRAPLERVVRQELWRILAHEFPDAVVTDRTARRPSFGTEAAVVFCAHPHRRRVLKLPGATIVARPGPGPEPEDPPFRDRTRVASEPRALLENARTTRPTNGLPASTLSRAELADWIAELVTLRGPDRMNRLRDDMREIADRLELETEFEVVDRLVGAALGSRDVPAAASTAVRALHDGRGFDQARVQRFDDLAAALDTLGLPTRAGATSPPRAFSFFEAYFSNFIEGTEFTVDEALEVVFADRVPAGHTPGDAHDVRGTHVLVSNPDDSIRVPADSEDLLELLTDRHRVLLGGRPDQYPGEFKRVANQAGTYVFVAPDLVEGTLEQAFVHSRSVAPGFARAIYWLFALAEIHPFADGNGRVARIFMNAELSAVGQARIIIPTVFRYEYLNGLRALSLSGHAEALLNVCEFAQSWTSAIDFSSVEAARAMLESTNAFVDPVQASDQGIRLQMP